MNTDNPFGMELDDDGLPKYSPDRQNIVGYHMFKLGLTDKLPDPEDTHTPFFRTPSWYEEKAQRERQSQTGLSPTREAEPGRIEPVKPDVPDFLRKYPVHGEAFHVGKKPAFPSPSIEDRPFAHDTRDPERLNEKSGPFGRPVEKGQNAPAPMDGNTFGRQVLERILAGMKPADLNGGLDKGLPGQPVFGFGMTGEARPDQASAGQPLLPRVESAPDMSERMEQVSFPGMDNPPDRMDTLWFPPEQTGKVARAYLSGDGGIGGIHPLLYVPDRTGRDDGFGKPPAYWSAEWRAGGYDSVENRQVSGRSPLPDKVIETVGVTGREEVPDHPAANMENDAAPGWMNEDTSQADARQEASASPDGDFSPDGLEPPSAGRPVNRPFRSVFVKDNIANPGSVPMQVALLSPGQLPIPGNRREVTPEMTHDINSRLTRLNRGWPIGINFTVLSRLEGGSSPYANLPIARKELELERREKMEAMERGVPPPQRKWANNSGVTIGSGFDLGQTSVEEMRSLGFPESLVEKCAPYVGKRRLDADDLLRKKPLVLSNEEIDLVNQTVMMDKAQKSIQDWDSRIARLKKTIPGAPFFHEMTSAQQTLVFSRYYHQGPGWIGRTANRPMFEAMRRNDWATVNRQLEGLSNRSGPKWLRDRFWKELEFLNGKYNKP